MERVHFDRDLGLAEVTADSMKAFCRRWHPDKYDEIAAYVEEHPETLYLDFEDILEAMEQIARYNGLIEAACQGGISSPEHRGFLTCLLIIHAMRSHEMMWAMVDATNSLGIAKWEYFWLLKNAWSDPLLLARAATPLASSRWVLYRTDAHKFPLCDSPVMIGSQTVMAILSPRLLLEMDLTRAGREDEWHVREGISSSKFREFRRRAIGNSFKEILFSDPEELERWRSEPEFRSRVATLTNSHQHRTAIADAAARVVWAVFGFGRVPDSFEQRVAPYFRNA